MSLHVILSYVPMCRLFSFLGIFQPTDMSKGLFGRVDVKSFIEYKASKANANKGKFNKKKEVAKRKMKTMMMEKLLSLLV